MDTVKKSYEFAEEATQSNDAMLLRECIERYRRSEVNVKYCDTLIKKYLKRIARKSYMEGLSSVTLDIKTLAALSGIVLAFSAGVALIMFTGYSIASFASCLTIPLEPLL